MKITKDKLFKEKKTALKSTIAFLRAIKSKLSKKKAIEVANAAAANYMIEVYKDVFKCTEPETQLRFDTFRTFYEAHPKKSPYCDILESTTNSLKVRFNRCPYAEILSSEGLFEFASSSCLSDISFTEKLLPGVEFARENSIVEGDNTCVMTWNKINKQQVLI